jgi:4'-phosphopantetheinyl transferase
MMRQRIERIEHKLARDIELYAVDTSPSPGDETFAASLLDANERIEAASFAKPTDRSRFVFRRAARRLLCAELGVSDQQELCYSADGRPIAGSLWPGVSFSSDHRCALLAFSRRFVLGIDIEHLRRIDDIEGVARTAFSPAERALLDPAQEASRTRRFFEIWTRKEAWLKGRGLGLTDDVTSQCIVAAGRVETPKDGGWRMANLAVRPGYMAALAWRSATGPAG